MTSSTGSPNDATPRPSPRKTSGETGNVDVVVGGIVVVVLVELGGVTVVTVDVEVLEELDDAASVVGASNGVVGSDSSGVEHPPNTNANTSA